MARHECATYPPLNQLKPVADNVWIVDGPLIQFPMPWLPWIKMAFPTRMTILRLTGGELLLHSPTELTEELRAQVEQLGRPRWIIGPNRIHYWWIPDWHKAFPTPASTWHRAFATRPGGISISRPASWSPKAATPGTARWKPCRCAAVI